MHSRTFKGLATQDRVGAWLTAGTGLSFVLMLGAKETWFIFVSVLVIRIAWSLGARLSARLGVAVLALALGFSLTLWTGMTQQVRVDTEEHQRAVAFGWPSKWLVEDLTNLDSVFPIEVAPADFREADGAQFRMGPLLWDTLLMGVMFFFALSLGRAVGGTQRRQDRS
jgi:hypothetical protein